MWWFLGLSGFVQFLFAIPMLMTLAVRGNVRIPRWFGIWLIFPGLMFASVLMLKVIPSQFGLDNLLSWGWRMTLYLGATVTFLYMYNTPREELPAKKLENILAGFWVLMVLGGLMGMALPNNTWNSLMEKLMPTGSSRTPSSSRWWSRRPPAGKAFRASGSIG